MSRKAENGVDWVRIRAEYVTTKTSLRKLAGKYGVAKSAVDKRSQKEGWVEAREAYNKSLCEKVIEKTSDEKSNKLAALIAAADEMTAVMQAALSDKDQFYRYIVDGVSVHDDESVVKKTETIFSLQQEILFYPMRQSKEQTSPQRVISRHTAVLKPKISETLMQTMFF